MKTVELPIFHLGKYRSANGVEVTFTPELLRQLERNTNFVIGQKALQPPVGYDHPAARDTHAHGRISGVRLDGGKLIASIEGTSEQLREDAKSFRRLTYSPEFHEKFSFVHEGQTVEVGPTVIGLAMLGAQRGAIKNTAMVPLSEVNFGEAVSAVETLMLRAELRSLGYLGEYEVDGRFFGEVENDARRFYSEDDMDEKEVARIVESAVSKNDEKWENRFKAFKTETENQIKSFSEEEKVKRERIDFAESVIKEKPPGKLGADAIRAFAANPTWETGKTLLLSLPAVLVPKDKAKEGEGGGSDELPEALSGVTAAMFSEPSKYDAKLHDAWAAFEKHEPKLAAPLKGKPQSERYAAVRTYLATLTETAN